MKSKTIKSLLQRKVNAWLATITDEDVRKLAAENIVITGGSIVNMLLNEAVNDYDVYFRTAESLFAVASYYLAEFKKNPPSKFKDGGEVLAYLADKRGIEVKTFKAWQDRHGANDRLRVFVKSQGVAAADGTDAYQYFEGVPDAAEAGAFVDQAIEQAEELKAKSKEADKPSYRPVFITSNAITLSDGIQIVVRFFGEPAKIHENFDFLHCVNWWQSWDGALVLKAEALECILNRELRYVGSKYPLCSIFRVRKFLDRGWKINAGQLLKACLQISQINLESVDTLEEQLIGVDAAYFHQVVNLCRARMEETGSDRVDFTYLIELVDRIF